MLLVCDCWLMFSELREFTCFVPDCMIFASEVKLICGWFDVEIGICLIGLLINIFALIWPESETLFSNRELSATPQLTAATCK
jgi:hypothetical protein